MFNSNEQERTSSDLWKGVKGSHPATEDIPRPYQIYRQVINIVGRSGQLPPKEQALNGAVLIAMGVETVVNAGIRWSDNKVVDVLRRSRGVLRVLDQSIDEMRPTKNSIFGKLQRDIRKLL